MKNILIKVVSYFKQYSIKFYIANAIGTLLLLVLVYNVQSGRDLILIVTAVVSYLLMTMVYEEYLEKHPHLQKPQKKGVTSK